MVMRLSLPKKGLVRTGEGNGGKRALSNVQRWNVLCMQVTLYIMGQERNSF